MSATSTELDAARLALAHRWAALATLSGDAPAASMVAYAAEPDLRNVLLFLSGLSEHTRNMINQPQVALVITENDSGEGDPQTLARLSIKGTAQIVERSTPDFELAWRAYVSRLPDAAPRIVLGDFSLFRVFIAAAHYVGGFAQAVTIPPDRLSEAAIEVDTELNSEG